MEVTKWLKPSISVSRIGDRDFDLTLTGFDEIQLGAFLADKTEGLTDPDDKTEGLTDPDDVPAVPEHPVSQPGDPTAHGR